jgi:hypothetical protein
MKVVEIKTRPAAIHESVVDRLEEALERARAGEVASVALAFVSSDGSTWCSWSETDDFARQLGSIARLQHRMNIRQDDA